MVTLDEWNPLVMWFKYNKLRAEVNAIDTFLTKEIRIPNMDAAIHADRLQDAYRTGNLYGNQEADQYNSNGIRSLASF